MANQWINPGHYLQGCRFDNWLRLMWQNRFHVIPKKIPQALVLTGTSLATFLPALLEQAVYGKRIAATPISQPPVFVIGFWRTGSTYLQNLLCQDPQFSYFDPVHTVTINNCLMMEKFLRKRHIKGLKGARPMDNLEYTVDSPMEEIFAVASMSDKAIIHMLALPRCAQYYALTPFVEDMTEKERKKWKKQYDHCLRKMTFVNKGKRLLLKSPDNSCRIRTLQQMYPGAKYIHLLRDPYTVVMSTIHMFKKQFGILSLQEMPDEELIEDTVIAVYRHMYQYLETVTFEEGSCAVIRYEDLVADPVTQLRNLYARLGLAESRQVAAYFDTYITSQSSYQRNRFTLSDKLCAKINDRLGFIFERYGYPMRSPGA